MKRMLTKIIVWDVWFIYIVLKVLISVYSRCISAYTENTYETILLGDISSKVAILGDNLSIIVTSSG